jgi:hypothetical protein
VCALDWVVVHPEDVRTLVSHEPPLVARLEDRETAIKVNADIVETYHRPGFGPAMAKFIQFVMHRDPLPNDYLDRPGPDPAQFGLPTEDDGSRDDLLLSGNLAMPPFVPDADALGASSVRLIPAIGALGEGGWPAVAERRWRKLLGVEPVIFPGDHGGLRRQRVVPGQRPGRVRREVAGAARRVGATLLSAMIGD